MRFKQPARWASCLLQRAERFPFQFPRSARERQERCPFKTSKNIQCEIKITEFQDTHFKCKAFS